MGGEGKENNAPKRDLDEESAAVVIQSRKYHYPICMSDIPTVKTPNMTVNE